MSEALRVGVLGARGRMGQQVCKAVVDSEDLDLVAAVDAGDWLFSVADGGAQVLVDFTHPDVVMDNIRFAVDQGIHAVVGTTGFTQERLDTVRTWLEDTPGLGVIVAPNFASGAALLMKFAATAARFYESVEVVELHHPDKVDAPSGTAMRTAEIIGEERARAGRGARWSPACTFMRSGCAGWLRTRKSCSETAVKLSPSDTIRSSALRSSP